MIACKTQEDELQGVDKERMAEIVTVDPDAPPQPQIREVLSKNISKMGEEVSVIDAQNGEAIPDA